MGVPGVQIDLLMERGDGIIDLCEMKYTNQEFVLTDAYEQELSRKKDVFSLISKTKSAVHVVMVTTNGLVHNKFYGDIQNEVVLNDLFE